MVVIEAEWRILVGSIFAANETLGIESIGVWEHRRIAMSLANACPQKPALRYAPTVECDIFEHPPHQGLTLIEAQRLKHGRHRKIYLFTWHRAFFRADCGGGSRIEIDAMKSRAGSDAQWPLRSTWSEPL